MRRNNQSKIAGGMKARKTKPGCGNAASGLMITSCHRGSGEEKLKVRIKGKLMNEFAVGIYSGLITSLLVFAFQSQWKKIIVPWYEERIYKDARIEGNWEIEYDGIARREIIALERKAHSVSGTIVGIAGEDIGKSYKLDGVFKNLLLTASYSSEDRTSLDRGTFTLFLGDNGNTLKGCSSYYEDESGTVTSDNCKWRRKIS